MKPFAPSLTARDLLVKNAMLVDVVTQSSYRGWFTVQGGRFVEVEAGDPTPADLAGLSIGKKRDLGGAWVQPGMLDVHMHIESSLVTPRRFAEAALPHGTTTVLQDPHEVANVAGAAGIRWMLEASRGLPQRMFTAISSCVPATSADIETPNASITPAEVSELARAPEVIALGEVMDYQGLVAGDAHLRAMVAAATAAGLSVEGHVPSLSGAALSRYVANGVRSDHTLASPAKLLEELRKGLWVMLQEKSLTLEVVQTVAALPDRSRILLITDDVMPDRLLTGHVSRLVDLAVDLGWPVLDAIASAPLRPARAARRPLDQSVGYALGRAFRLLNRHVSAAVRAHGLSAAHVNILLTLWARGALPIGELQALLGFSSSAFTGAIDRMEAAGLVRRVPSPTDRRSFLVEPASWPKTRRADVIDALEAAEDDFLSDLTAPEKAQLLTLLRKISPKLA